MVYERFVKQLDGCTYCSGGLNCNCASEAMWLWRASQGKIATSSCDVRRRTGDKAGGTNLEQIEQVSLGYGITTGRVYKPIMATALFDMVRNGRGAVLQIGYSVIAGTRFDCFDGRFRGGHSLYLSRVDGSYTYAADPGADGRRSSIPRGFQSYPTSLLIKAAGALQLSVGGQTVNQRYGLGRAFAYVTPQDPPTASPSYHAVVTKTTKLWNPSTQKWVYSLPPNTQLIVRGAGYTMDGVLCHPVQGPAPYSGYFVPKANIRLGAPV